MNKERIIEKLKGIKVLFDEPLSKYTYTKVGGVGECVCFPQDINQLQAIIKYSKQEDIPFLVLGNASNVIIDEEGLDGFIVFTTDLTFQEVDNTRIRVGSGLPIKKLSALALANGLTGLEFACGIPGSVGGGIFMNAGCYGGELKDVISEVKALDQDGNLVVYSNRACDFSYRTSIFQLNGEVIVEATFELSPGSPKEIEEIMNDLMRQRSQKQPLEYPSCGSVFKRPEGYFVGKLISDANLKGYRIGGVEVSKKHAGFMVNVDNGTANDYLELISYVQDKIYEIYGIKLEKEVRILKKEK